MSDSSSSSSPSPSPSPSSSLSSSSSSSSPPSSSPLDDPPSVLTKILSLEEIDTDLYRGFSPLYPRFQRIFGGQTIGQALAAAGKTVSSDYCVHSLHAYFIRAGNDDLPILYSVERVRNGKSFLTRRVIARQKGQAIFILSASFQKPELGLEHHYEMPDAPSPESLPGVAKTAEEVQSDPRIHNRMKESLLKQATMPFPMDVRTVIPSDFGDYLKKLPPKQRLWMKVKGKLPDDPLLHQCALAYMSDWSFLETSLMPHGVRWYDAVRKPILQLASIDHSMWFHHPFRADRWLLYDMESPVATSTRGLQFGRFFSEDGTLVVSTAQEGLIRLKNDIVAPVANGSPMKPLKFSDQSKQNRLFTENFSSNDDAENQAKRAAVEQRLKKLQSRL